MKKIVLLVTTIFYFQIIHGQEYADLLGEDFYSVFEILKEAEGIVDENEQRFVDDQKIRSLRFIIDNEQSYAREVTFLFISDVCISQLYRLHFEKTRNLITQLDTNLLKSPTEDYTWSKSNTYVDLMYQIKKIPPDHVLTIWLDVRNSLIPNLKF